MKSKDCVCDSGHEWCCSNKGRNMRKLGGLGHTAYNHVGNDGLEGLGYTPSPSSPYYHFGFQHRFPYNWSGGSGGVAWATSPAAETRGLSGLGSLGNADLLESGLERGQYPHNPVFSRTMLHDPRYVPTGDWPLIRPQGPEPMGFDPFAYYGINDPMAKIAIVLALGAGGFLLWKKFGRRKNPARNPKRIPYSVIATTTSSGKRRKRRKRSYGSIGFTTKSSAAEYADYLRLGGHKARVKRNPRRRRRSRR